MRTQRGAMKHTAKFNGKVDQIYWIWCAVQKNSEKYTARNSLNLNAEGYKCETGKAIVFESPRMHTHMGDDYVVSVEMIKLKIVYITVFTIERLWENNMKKTL